MRYDQKRPADPISFRNPKSQYCLLKGISTADSEVLRHILEQIFLSQKLYVDIDIDIDS